MTCIFFATIFLGFLSHATTPLVPLYQLELLYSFQFINFSLSSDQEIDQYFNSGAYKNTIIADIAISHRTGDIYLAIPRLKDLPVEEQPPATLAIMDTSYLALEDDVLQTPVTSPLFTPFPNIMYNSIGVPSSLQSVTSIEIDSEDVLWILDCGRVGIGTLITDAAKIIRYNLFENYIMSSYSFSEPIINQFSYLESFVIDPFNNFVYITDSGIFPLDLDTPDTIRPGIVKYSINDPPLRIFDNITQVRPEPGYIITVNSTDVFPTKPWLVGARAIGMTHNYEQFIFSPMTGRKFYTLPSSNPTLNDFTEYSFPFSTSDLAISENEKIFTTNLFNSSIDILDLETGTNTRITNESISSRLVWPSKFGFDHKGWLLFTTNQLHNFLSDSIEFPALSPSQYYTPVPVNDSKSNFRVWRVFVNTVGYLDDPLNPSNSGNQTTGSKNPSSFNFSAGFALFLLLVLFFSYGYGCFTYTQIKHERLDNDLNTPFIGNPEMSHPKASIWARRKGSSIINNERFAGTLNLESQSHISQHFVSPSSALSSTEVDAFIDGPTT